MFTISHLPGIDVCRGATDDFAVCDLPGLADLAERASKSEKGFGENWYGSMGYAESLRCVREGNLDAVPAADAIMEKLADLTISSSAYRTINDVCGGVPNVPNYIAGIPEQMRRRKRQNNQTAPLSVFADLTSSGMIAGDMLAKRGVAILALCRLLTNVRPVELWAFVGTGTPTKQAHYVCCQLDTAPLDLARAAHVLSHPSVPRALMYTIATHFFRWRSGNWPYGDVSKLRNNAKQILERVLMPGSQALYIPAIHGHDKAVSDPVAWIREYLATYGGQAVETEN